MSSLPVIAHPKFQTEIPSTGEKVTYRPFTGREQKVMLVAKESGALPDIVNSLIEVIGACAPDVDVKKLPMFDLEYLFLRIRAKSVGGVIEVKITDREDGKKYDAKVDLEQMKFVAAEKTPNVVKITDSVALKLKYPSAADVVRMGADADEWDMLAASVSAVVNGEDVISSGDLNHGELKEWLKSIPLSTLEGVKAFFESRPKLVVAANYVKDGKPVSHELSGIGDFFN